MMLQINIPFVGPCLFTGVLNVLLHTPREHCGVHRDLSVGAIQLLATIEHTCWTS